MAFKVGELFAGIGGVTGGLLDAGGYDPVVLVDNDPSAARVFRINFPDLRRRYYTRKINGSISGSKLLDLAGGELDGLLGCPPCQGLSAAGLRDPSDDRNDLLFQMRRLIKAVEPKFFIMENVPRLLRSPIYKDFTDSLESKYEIRADSINAAEYGVPQLRRRAVIIGFNKKLGVEPTLPPPTHGGTGRVFDYSSGTYVSPSTPAGREALKLRPLVPRCGGRYTPPEVALVTLAKALTDLPVRVPVSSDKKLLGLATGQALEYSRPAQSEYQRRVRGDSIHVLNHRAWHHGAEIVERLEATQAGDCPLDDGTRGRNTRYFSQAYARLHRDGLARTITTNFHNPGGGRFTHYAAARTITLREALRLQGFPDAFRFEGVFGTDARRLVGNAFPRLLAEAIGKHVAGLLK